MRKLVFLLIAFFLNISLVAQEEVPPLEYTIPPEFQTELLGTWKEPLPRYLGLGVLGLGSAGALVYSFTSFYNFYEGVKEGSFERQAHESLYTGVLGIVVSASLSILFKELFLGPHPPQRFLPE